MTKKAIIAILGAVGLAACGKPQPEPNHVQQLMKDVVQPQADIFWHSSGSIVDAQGVHDLTPTTDEGWNKTVDSAAKIVEAGNLLMTDKYAKGRAADWKRFSQGLVDIGKQAQQAAADHNGDKVFEIGGTMYDVCSACHQAYPPPVPPVPENSTAAG